MMVSRRAAMAPAVQCGVLSSTGMSDREWMERCVAALTSRGFPPPPILRADMPRRHTTLPLVPVLVLPPVAARGCNRAAAAGAAGAASAGSTPAAAAPVAPTVRLVSCNDGARTTTCPMTGDVAARRSAGPGVRRWGWPPPPVLDDE